MMSAVSRAEARMKGNIPGYLVDEAISMTKQKMAVKNFPPEYEPLLLEDEIVEACSRALINGRCS